jgi:hypothetical protein
MHIENRRVEYYQDLLAAMVFAVSAGHRSPGRSYERPKRLKPGTILAVAEEEIPIASASAQGKKIFIMKEAAPLASASAQGKKIFIMKEAAPLWVSTKVGKGIGSTRRSRRNAKQRMKFFC